MVQATCSCGLTTLSPYPQASMAGDRGGYPAPKLSMEGALQAGVAPVLPAGGQVGDGPSFVHVNLACHCGCPRQLDAGSIARLEAPNLMMLYSSFPANKLPKKGGLGQSQANQQEQPNAVCAVGRTFQQLCDVLILHVTLQNSNTIRQERPRTGIDIRVPTGNDRIWQG